MIDPRAKLSEKLFTKEMDWVPTRNGYGEGLVEAGKKNVDVVALCADLTESTRTEGFKKEFPDRFIEMGVAEQNLVTVAAGLAAVGKIPFVASYGAFSPGRNWEQIRTTICYNDRPVKIIGAHTGVSVGPDGATHQMLEDMALMRALPNMVVIAPCDSIEAKKATVAAAENGRPTYMRFAREKTPVMTTQGTPFEIGQAQVFRQGKRVTIIACGPVVYEALLAAEEVDGEVINCHTIKPLDQRTILESVRKTGRVITVEEHQITGGLGGAIAELLGEHEPVPMKRVGVHDRFGESGEPDELLRKFGLKAEDIVDEAKQLLR